MKPSTALLVIDIQVGAFDAKLIPAIDGAAELLIRIAALVDAARCAGRSPELNPVENVWQFIRNNWLSNRVFKSYEDILDYCCYALNQLID